MKIVIKTFSELSNIELYQILKLRQEVFIVEQNCPYSDLDDLDQQSFHTLGTCQNKLVAYSRILPKGMSYQKYCAIGRVVTEKGIRGQKFGQQIFESALKHCLKLFPNEPIKLSAQVYIKQFYENFGFKETGVTYLEDDIPHIAMVYQNHAPYDINAKRDQKC